MCKTQVKSQELWVIFYKLPLMRSDSVCAFHLSIQFPTMNSPNEYLPKISSYSLLPL